MPPVQALADEYDVPYVDFNAELPLTNDDFHDLSHLVEPGRVVWQTRLAEELVRLLGAEAAGRGRRADGARPGRRAADVRIYFTWYLIPVVIAALLVFWLRAAPRDAGASSSPSCCRSACSPC